MALYERHPFSAIYSDLSDDELQAMADSIKKAGRIREKITRFKGKILDGWQRHTACKIAKVAPLFEDFQGTEADALDFVEDKNDRRRHENVATRAIDKKRINDLRVSLFSEEIGTNVPPKTIAQMAEEAGVSKQSMKDANSIVATGAAVTEKAAKNGDISLRDAGDIARTTPKKDQAAAVKAAKDKPTKEAKPKAEPKPKKPKTPKPQLTDMVTKDEYNKLMDDMNGLGERFNEQASMLQTYEDVRNDKSAAAITALKAELVNCRRRRDELMNKSSGDEKMIVSLQRKLKKYESAEKK